MDGHDRLIVDLHLDLSVSFVPLIGLHRDGIRIESCGWFAAKFSFSRVFFLAHFCEGEVPTCPISGPICVQFL